MPWPDVNKRWRSDRLNKAVGNHSFCRGPDLMTGLHCYVTPGADGGPDPDGMRMEFCGAQRLLRVPFFERASSAAVAQQRIYAAIDSLREVPMYLLRSARGCARACLCVPVGVPVGAPVGAPLRGLREGPRPC